MRFFKLHSKFSTKDILDNFDKLSESESHNILTSFFENYYSSRIGIHSYIDKNRVSGYYETGKRHPRVNTLVSQKNWFFLTVNQTTNGTTIRGCIFGDIFFMCMIYLPLILVLIDFLTNYPNLYGLFEFLLVSVLCGFILYKEYKIQIKLYNQIVSLINQDKVRDTADNYLDS